MPPVSVGVDPSANGTGVVIIDAAGAPLHEEVLCTGLTGLERLVQVRARLRAILSAHGPFAVGVRESYSLGSVNRPFLLGEIGGIVQLELFDHCARVEECAPKALKKFATGNASASKGEVMTAVRERWGQCYEDDNLADAYVLARVGLAALDTARVTRRDQLEVLLAMQAPKKKRRNTSFRLSRDVI